MGSQFQSPVCNCYHDVLMISMNLNDIAILKIHRGGHPSIINGIS